MDGHGGHFFRLRSSIDTTELDEFACDLMRTATLGFLVLVSACVGDSALYPPRPLDAPMSAIADPSPSRVVLHATITAAGMKKALEDNVPLVGEGVLPLLRRERKFTWRRGPVALKFDRGRLAIELHVDANVDMPVGSIDAPLDFHIAAEPVLTSEYKAKLQSIEVRVTSEGKLIRAVDKFADVLPKIQGEIDKKIADFVYDLRPILNETFQRIVRPIDLPIGDATGCAYLRVLSVEAGPTVLADGFEKDLAFVVAPSVTFPCALEDKAEALPPLANVSSIPSGPFVVSIPIAARYDELAKAMTLAFSDGKLFFSKEHPDLYLTNPEVYASREQLVLKLRIAGPARKFGVNVDMNGDLFMTGHPAVVDNELRVPDLEPTIETSNFLLKVKATIDGAEIREQARAALRLDLSARLKVARDKLSTNLTFGDGQGCVRADTDKIEVNGVHVHSQYLRVYVSVTGRTNAYVPCPR